MYKNFYLAGLLIMFCIIPATSSAVVLSYELSGTNPGGTATFTYNDPTVDGDTDHRDLVSVTGDFGDGLFTYLFNETLASSGLTYNPVDLSFTTYYCCGGSTTSTNSSALGTLSVGTNGPTWMGAYFNNVRYDFNAVPGQPNTAVPEPSAIALMGLGLLGFVATRRKIKK